MGNLKPGYYMQTSPPVVTRNLVIVGSSINDNESVNNPSGVIRARRAHRPPSLELGQCAVEAKLKEAFIGRIY